jgi:hypothetical protein
MSLIITLAAPPASDLQIANEIGGASLHASHIESTGRAESPFRLLVDPSPIGRLDGKLNSPVRCCKCLSGAGSSSSMTTREP